jgi:hypothetical protein
MNMKHTTPDSVLSRELLCFVRDANPTAEEFAERFGGPGGQVFHVLRKHGVVVVKSGRLRLSRRHLSPDGRLFYWGFRVFHLDQDVVMSVRYGPEGPPVFSDDP